MIKLQVIDGNTFGMEEIVVKPTIFPDNTSQVWKLPEEMLNKRYYRIVWHFESEREIIDVLSLRKLIFKGNVDLHIPYLPFARQDKSVANRSTFNLHVFADLINTGNFTRVTAVDVHSNVAAKLIKNFENVCVSHIVEKLKKSGNWDTVVFPDSGAYFRYERVLSEKENIRKICCVKKRNQLTGQIQGIIVPNHYLKPNERILIIDDICDGGGTFVHVAKELRAMEPTVHITLYVTHGIFSKGKQLEGIDEILTTNSLFKNTGCIEV